MKKIVIPLILLLTTVSWARESFEIEMRKLVSEFTHQKMSIKTVEQTDRFDGLCLAPAGLPVRADINEACGRYCWALLPEYYYDYEVDSVGTNRSLDIDYRPNSDVFRLFPAFYGIWSAEPHTSLKSYRDGVIAAGKAMGGASYTEISNAAETYYSGISGWKYVYKFFSSTSYYIWYSHILWKDNVGYTVFFLCQEKDYLSSMKQFYFTTVLALVRFESTLAVQSVGELPAVNSPKIAQNFPNPFNAETCIQFQLEQACEVELSIYNTLGQKIRTLLQEFRPAGSWQAKWDGRDDQGRLVPSGIYFYRMLQSGEQQTRQMLLLK